MGPSVHESDVLLQSEERQGRSSEETYKDTKGSMLGFDSSLKKCLNWRISKIFKNYDRRGKINYRHTMRKVF